MITKTCKIHGELSQENIYKRKGKKENTIRYECYLCMKERWATYYKNNKEKALKSNLEYTRRNREKIKVIRNKTREKNREKQNEFYRQKYNKECKDVSDNYIKMILSRFGNLAYKDIPKELIDIKRYCLLIKREVWKRKNGNSKDMP